VKLTKDMLDLAKHIVNSKTAPFEPEKFEDQYEAALIDLINKKRAGQVIASKAHPAAGNVVNLMDALRASLGQERARKTAKKPKKPAGQKEMLLPIDGKKPANEEVRIKTTAQISLANSPDTLASAMAPKPDGLGKFPRVRVGSSGP
jgi:DNA end-binding protein Ku